MMRPKSCLRHTVLLILATATLAGSQLGRDLSLRTRENDGGKATSEAPAGYALVVGVGEYGKIKGNDLRFSESDAAAFYRVLISANGGGFASENVRLLVGPRATLANVREAIESWLPSVVKPQDRVVVYFAGHGFVLRGKGYLALWDTEIGDLQGTGYPMSVLARALRGNITARWKALFIDACHAGKFNAESTDEGLSQQLNETLSDSQYLSLTATLGRERSFEDADLGGGFGVFTYFLVRGIQGEADNPPCDGWVTAGELVEYVRAEVIRYAKLRKVSQTPHAGSDFDPEMVLGRAGKCNSRLDEPSVTGEAEIETNLAETEVFLNGELVGRASPARGLKLPGIVAGEHTIKACKAGYECDVRKVIIIPGRATGVRVHIRYPKRSGGAAEALARKGENLLYSRRSAISPMNMVPVTRTQSKDDVLEARKQFAKALELDPGFAAAAYHLGVASQLLGDEKSAIAALRTATRLDPGDIQARVQYGGVLIESGDPDEAIIHLHVALQLDGRNAEAFGLLARAYLDKASWAACLEAASEAIRLSAEFAAPYLWRADCRRMLAVKDNVKHHFETARDDYEAFLEMTKFATSARQWIAYHFIGFHLGGKAHADRRVSHELLRAAGYMGICICEKNLGRSLRARAACLRAVELDPADPIAHFLAGTAQLAVYRTSEGCAELDRAAASFRRMLAINSELAEAARARHYLEEIRTVRSRLAGRSGCL